jgi:asparagine synthase (glutamine-hydrolysing)
VSGICGAIHAGNPPSALAPELLDHMLAALAHRGSLDWKASTQGGVALGERRSSGRDFEDLDYLASNEDGQITAVVDGAIFNDAELRAELSKAGHAVRTNCPGELFSHLYEEFGSSFPARIRGDFAFAVWDASHRRAVLGRDHMGARPLYYARPDDLFLFASELKGVLASGLVAGDLDYEAIDAYLALGCIPAPRTLLTGVSKLPAAHCLIVEAGGIRTERFWEYPKATRRSRDRDVDRHAEKLRSVLDDAVRVRLDGQAGVLLSGGLDSSLILALMTPHTTDPVKTLTLGFADPGQPNELAEARWIAETLKSDHQELPLALADHASDLVDFVWSLDEPVADFGSLGLLAGAKLAGQHAPVCFSGAGADSGFGGLPRMLVVAGIWDRLPLRARRVGRWLLARGSARMRRAGRILGVSDPAERFLVLEGLLTEERRACIVRGEVAALGGHTARRLIREHLRGVVPDPLTSYIAVEEQLAADFLLHTFDRAAAIGRLEMRLPFYDHRVVEYAASLPNRLKLRGLQTKFLLKHAARGLVPDRVIDKPKIAFLYDSRAAWLRAQIPGAIADYLLAPAPRYTEFLDRGEIEKIIADHAESREPREGAFLLAVLLLEIWLSAYLPRALAPPAPRL